MDWIVVHGITFQCEANTWSAELEPATVDHVGDHLESVTLYVWPEAAGWDWYLSGGYSDDNDQPHQGHIATPQTPPAEAIREALERAADAIGRYTAPPPADVGGRQPMRTRR